MNKKPLFWVATIAVLLFSVSAYAEEVGWFPEEHLFEPPLANLREPVITFRYFYEDSESMGEANVAGRLPFWGWEKNGVSYQVGLEGGAFSSFELSGDPRELKNTDYRIALPLSFRKGNLSGRLQVYHQSSHLGDTYQREKGRQSIHFSREKVEFLLARQVGAFRFYGGAGTLFNSDPDVGKATVQAGWEYRTPFRSDWDFYFGQDWQCREEVEWTPDIATQAGFAFKRKGRERIRFFVEYFHGYSQQGQFSNEKEEWVGIGSSLLL